MNIPLRAYWRLLHTYLRMQWRRVALLAVVLVTMVVCQLVNPQIIRFFIDTAQQGGAPSTLLRAALGFMAIALATQVLSVSAVYLGENIGWTATNALRVDLAEHCLGLDLSFHKGRLPGELIERVDGDVNALSNFFSQLVLELLTNLALLLGVLTLLWTIDWRIGAVLTVLMTLTLWALMRAMAWATPIWRTNRQMSATFYGFLGEQLAGTVDVRSSGATGYVMRRFYEQLRTWWPIQRRANIAGYSMGMTSLLLFSISMTVALGLGTLLWRAGAITIGTVYILFHYTSLLQGPIQRIRTQLQDLQQASASIERVQELFATRSKLTDGDQQLPQGALEVRLDHVSFAYDADEPVLHDVSLRIAPGTVVGLLGRTGSGKSTLGRLLLRLYDPTSGTVALGGVALPTAELAQVRQRVGMVTQEVQLFNATVRDNLTFFDRSITDDQILAVLDDLGLRPWLDRLPAGLDSELAANSSLSAGEAQLLAFTRLFLSDPGLVIMDEASSRLDPATEQLIERAVSKLLQGRTGIIIAHRLGTIQRADEIVILENGRVVEHGPRAALANDPNSELAHLLQTGLEAVLV